MKWKALIAALALTTVSTSAVLAADVTGLRASDSMNRSRVVLDVSEVPEGWTSSYNATSHEVTVTLPNSTNSVSEGVINGGKEKGVLKGIVLDEHEPLKVTLQADKAIKYNTFVLHKPERIVVDMFAAVSNKTSKQLDNDLDLVKWNTTVAAGPIQATALTVPSSVGMQIYSSQSGNSVTTVSSVNKAAVGLKVKGKYIPSANTNQVGDGVVPDSLVKSAQLVYGDGRGYTINKETPSLQVAAKDWALPVTGINQSRQANDLIVYTSAFGKSTGTNAFGQEVTVKDGKVTALSKADTALTKGDIVLSGHGTSAEKLKTLKVGDSLAIKAAPAVAKVSTEGAVTYAKGTPVLISGSYVGPSSSSHMARTFLGTTKKRGLIALTIDKNSNSVGVTTKEGADLLKQLGAVDGLELTGQGSAPIAYKGKDVHTGSSEDANYEDILVLK